MLLTLGEDRQLGVSQFEGEDLLCRHKGMYLCTPCSKGCPSAEERTSSVSGMVHEEEHLPSRELDTKAGSLIECTDERCILYMVVGGL